jgi:uncharacterized membrane protein
MNLLALQLLLHGAIVLLVGSLAGMPYGRAIVYKKDESVIDRWRVAHSALVMGGTTMIAISAAISQLELGFITTSIIVWALVISGYGFSIALTYGAWAGHRGLVARKPIENQVVYTGNILGAVGSLIGTLALIFGCFKMLL